MDSPHRPLSGAERDAITKLVAASPSDFAPVLAQLPVAWVIGRCKCGCATIDIAVPDSAPTVPGGFTGLLPAEGSILRASDPADGLIVFLRAGRLVGLEVYGVTEHTIRELPPADEIVVEPTRPGV